MERKYVWPGSSRRPDLMLITNHGYAGVEIPVGGAPDTGGQNFYVNSLALALERAGYRVTIIARGGFPFFKSEAVRDEPELLSEHVRYIYVPGGGEEFIRKEDIAVALDAEVEWLDEFIRQEAQERGCRPWEVYEVVNTHYWDAAVMGMRLVEGWLDDAAWEVLAPLGAERLGDGALDELGAARHWDKLGERPGYYLGRALLNRQGEDAFELMAKVEAAVEAWSSSPLPGGAEPSGSRKSHPGSPLKSHWEVVKARLQEAVKGTPPPLEPGIAYSVLGRWALEVAGVSQRLQSLAREVDRHVWTPHSIGDLKAENYQDKPKDVVRSLKFCERRDHERAVCHRTRYFAATSQEIAEKLHTHLGVEWRDIFYFPPCVDGALFRRYSPEELAPVYDYLEEETGVSKDALKTARVVFETSRMDTTKRKDLLLDAFAQVAQHTENVYLFIGGGPNSSQVFQDLEKKRQAHPVLQKRAFLLGYIPEEQLAPMFGRADIFASASEMEGFGMSASQAALAGAALVLSDLIPFGVQYVPEDAILFPAGDADAMAQGIRDLLDDDARRKERVQRLVEITKTLDWDTQSGRFLEHLRNAGLKIQRGIVESPG